MGYFFLFVNHTFVWFSPLRFSPAQGGQHFSAPDQIEITNASSQQLHFYVFFRGFSTPDILGEVCVPCHFAALLILKF